ncbi:MAG: sigma-70 family RNA polymerase sigma factor [Desulfobacterales bacterium]
MKPEKQRPRLVEFFRSEYDRLVGYVRRMIDDAAERDGEDIVQDVMLNAFNLADLNAPIENVSAYLYQSVRNRVVDYLRKRKSGTVSLEELVLEESDLKLGDLLYDADNNPVVEFERREMLHFLFEAIDALNEEQRVVLIETEFEGRTFKELAKEWGVPVGTLLARKSRALAKIRKIFQDINI